MSDTIQLNWEIGVDDDGEGFLSAHREPNELYIQQIDDEKFYWHVVKDSEDGSDTTTDVAEGEAPSLVAAMAAAETAIQ